MVVNGLPGLKKLRRTLVPEEVVLARMLPLPVDFPWDRVLYIDPGASHWCTCASKASTHSQRHQEKRWSLIKAFDFEEQFRTCGERGGHTIEGEVAIEAFLSEVFLFIQQRSAALKTAFGFSGRGELLKLRFT